MKAPPPASAPGAEAERWRQIQSLLDEAFDLPPAERPAFLDRACPDDALLRSEVEALLAADEAAGAFLGQSAADYAAPLLAEDAAAGEAPAEDLAGRAVGPYRLLREVGSGGMGVVWEAEDMRLGRRVAVKLLPRELSRDHGAKQRFLREARAASALDHPNLCTVHDVGESEGRLFIVMAFYRGETLRERLARGPLPVEEAKGVALQLARGLARAHEAGIVHRDLKPANVMLTERGEAKLLDFGIAKLGSEASLTASGAFWGTPAYMAPEQARGEPADARADLWSLGAMLYEMLAGRRPFRGDTAAAVVASILTREPEPLDTPRLGQPPAERSGTEGLPPEVPPPLARTVERLLAKDPARRHASAAELAGELEAGGVAGDGPGAAGSATATPAGAGAHAASGPATATAAGGRRPSRLRAGVLAGLAAVTALAVLLAVRWLPGVLAGPPPVRVALLAPSLSAAGDDPDFASAASEVLEAALATLTALEAVQPLDPPSRDEASGSAAERLRAAEADELLRPLLDCRGEACKVTLRRLAGSTGTVLATIGPFEVPVRIDKSQRLAEAVGVHLKRLYPRYRLRAESAGGAVRPEDYGAFVEIDRRNDRGERLGSEALARLDAILDTSPDLLGARLLAAALARGAGDLERAGRHAEAAHRLAPHDLGPLLQSFGIELEADRLDRAEAALARLSALAPGDARVLAAEAQLLEARGELEAARRLREEVVRRRPTWRQILALATLEVRLGEGASARRRLRELLEQQPDNSYVLENLAFLEAELGDLREAAAAYERLIAARPIAAHLSSLGFVRYLLGDFDAAAAAYRRALDLEPGRRLARFNLAAAQEARGERAPARAAYLALAAELEAAPGEPEPRASMLHAQCLARLGRRDEATQLTEEVVRRAPEDVQVQHQAAQVYALLGERLSALYHAERCLKAGKRREWLTLPEFTSLAGDPEYQALLDRYRLRLEQAPGLRAR